MCCHRVRFGHRAPASFLRAVVLIDTINAHSYIPAHSYVEDQCVRAPQTHARARACACAFGCPGIRAEPCEPFPSAWIACGFGAQAFYGASAFNANIGAWNTASVTTLEAVCAAFRPGGAQYGGRARPGFDAARPVVRGGTADARACAHTYRHTRLRGLPRGVRTAARRGDSKHVHDYLCRYIYG